MTGLSPFNPVLSMAPFTGANYSFRRNLRTDSGGRQQDVSSFTFDLFQSKIDRSLLFDSGRSSFPMQNVKPARDDDGSTYQ
jgi:hypothetical protein